MSRHTGGSAWATISTRSTSFSPARRSASAIGTIPSGSFSGPFRRTSGAMISRLSRCLRSALGVRRSRKVAMSKAFQRAPRQTGPQTTKARPRPEAIPAGPSQFAGDVVGDLPGEVVDGHHAEVVVAPGAHGNGPVCLFLVAHDEDVRDLLQRMLSYFIGYFLVPQI